MYELIAVVFRLPVDNSVDTSVRLEDVSPVRGTLPTIAARMKRRRENTSSSERGCVSRSGSYGSRAANVFAEEEDEDEDHDDEDYVSEEQIESDSSEEEYASSEDEYLSGSESDEDYTKRLHLIEVKDASSSEDEWSDSAGEEDDSMNAEIFWCHDELNETGPLLPGKAIMTLKGLSNRSISRGIKCLGDVDGFDTARFERTHRDPKKQFLYCNRHLKSKTNMFVLKQQAERKRWLVRFPNRPHRVKSAAVTDSRGRVYNKRESIENSISCDVVFERPWCPVQSRSLRDILAMIKERVCDHEDVCSAVIESSETGEFRGLVPKLKLFGNHERAAVILSSGHYVLMKNGKVCLFLGCFHRTAEDDSNAFDCAYLPLVPYDYLNKKQRRELQAPKLRSSIGYSSCLHPGAKLPWLRRLSTDRIVIAASSNIRLKITVQPAFACKESTKMTNDGHLLVHGICNYAALRNEEVPS